MQTELTAEIAVAESVADAAIADRQNGNGVSPTLMTTHPLLSRISGLPPGPDGETPLQPTLVPAELQALEDLFSRLPKTFTPEQHDLILRAYVVASAAHSRSWNDVITCSAVKG